MSVTTTKGDTTNNQDTKGNTMSEVSTPTRYDRAALWEHPDRFYHRHIGPSAQEIQGLLETCGFETLDQLVDTAVPAGIRMKDSLNLPEPATEAEALAELRSMASKNRVFRSFIGAGYSDCITPGVIQRNILENPGWYTQYTPYQPEIAQGRLEGLLNFQTMVTDFTGLEIANASMLDEPTAAAEAMTMCFGLKGNETKQKILVASGCHPQTIEVIKTRAAPLNVEVEVANPATAELDSSIFAVLLQYPDTRGEVADYSTIVEKVHANDGLVIVATDLLALTLLTPPGEWGVDVAVGNSQRFGVPLGFGGPHAAFFATRDAFKRRLPGRLVGVSKDVSGRPALRLALQTREQHIRRDRATSNICTAQVLLAVIASMYAVYHGPDGLKAIATRLLYFTRILAAGLRRLGYELVTEPAFDTFQIRLRNMTSAEIAKIAEGHQINLRCVDDQTIGIALDETTTESDLNRLFQIFNGDKAPDFAARDLADEVSLEVSKPFARKSSFLTESVFNRYHSETEMLRYIRRLESRDLSLTTSMIPLGSCTMKLNAAAEMFPVTWPEFNRLHPFAPLNQAEGYLELFKQLESWLVELTGLEAVSLQPNAGSQGEYAGLLAIHAYHRNRGEGHRNVCLIPTSAHGTNPASAVMAGLRVVAVACDDQGNIDFSDLREKAETHRDNLAALMVTYPSTHGVFEETIQSICQIVHDSGGQVFMDGANMNAQVGLCRPGDMGADVCHLNLHKTFCIPHGGGGPGMGPICVANHLAPFRPTHPHVDRDDGRPIGAIAASPWSSASILVISWAYIRMMGAKGLTQASKMAILNANYVAKRVEDAFPVLYKGKNGVVAHECILDFRHLKRVTVEDVAKRLMDYGFHAPTISWPVPSTMMVEPTESESKGELDRFCQAFNEIYKEVQAVESGQVDPKDNLLKNAPHTIEAVASDNWERPYSREEAAYPVSWLRHDKFWSAVGRIDNVYGDRYPVCTCVGMEAYTP